MPSKKKGKARTSRRTPPTGGGTRRDQGTSGDIPRRQAVDYRTASVAPPMPSGMLSYRQLAPLQTLSVVGGVSTSPSITFALNGIIGSSTLQSLFDLYKIDAIRMTVRPQNNAVGVVDPAVTKLVNLYWVIDYNDAVPLASAAGATEYDNCMILSPGESGERTFCPMYNLVAQSTSGTDYIARKGDWLDTSSDDILHYGCKFWVPAGNALQAVLQTWTVEIEYFLTFKQVS